MTFDVAYRTKDKLVITCDRSDLSLYVITGEDVLDIVKQFRKIIGRSYIPPKFAFGYGQSRWGYKTKDDFRKVVNEHRKKHIPLDMVYMDIDYMDDFKDFTLHKDEFKDFPEFVEEMKAQNIHLVPIIDAGVKIEKGYDIYEEGVKNNYFCKREDGSESLQLCGREKLIFRIFLMQMQENGLVTNIRYFWIWESMAFGMI